VKDRQLITRLWPGRSAEKTAKISDRVQHLEENSATRGDFEALMSN